ncbi:uncharacterized protein FA14DRAFT_3275 [Meira miltonrushii]|uniref:Uncharacterized protein n=1 Tax=Meira miltonrushii TaxID=1280837 RepID=A0A316VJM0_9BASI|nr:uncharacterized protein FA14DRAFT_3275 [Meira miltonrushii]PWN36493.1 hypothetical protein FA14DRAFT_3275 [Meira miltonrushii]
MNKMSKNASYPTKDEHWKTIKELIEIILKAERKPSVKESMNAHFACFALETGEYKDKADSVYYRKPNGQRVHGVRIRTAKLIRQHCEVHMNETRQDFLDKWQRATKLIFTYHDRHYVKREQHESTGPPNYETANMLDFGMMVWDEVHLEQHLHTIAI